MSYDVFISYATEDLQVAERIARALSSLQLNVFFDRKSIETGTRFDQVIERALAGAQCVVVLWSKISVAKEWVRDESMHALDRHVVIPCIIDDLEPKDLPLRFKSLNAISMDGWSGERDHPGYQRLVEAIGRYLPQWDLTSALHVRPNVRFPLGDESRRFVPSNDLREAAEIAMAVARPLLLMGEYGTPKMVFASYLADKLQGRLFMFNADENSIPGQLMYEFDSEAFLLSAQREAGPLNREDFIRKGLFWQAFEEAGPSVIAVDGLEMTNSQFQVGLLRVLSSLEFFVPETGGLVSAVSVPIVILVHELGAGVLPDQRLLRRCVTCRLPPPSSAELAFVLRMQVPYIGEALMTEAIRIFRDLRDEQKMFLPPSVADLIDWVRVLHLRLNEDGQQLRSVQVRNGGLAEIPYYQALVHDPRDIDRLRRESTGKGGDGVL